MKRLVGMILLLSIVSCGSGDGSGGTRFGIATDHLRDGYFHAFYQEHLLARGGKDPFLWEVIDGSVPPGVDLEAEGRLWGTCTRAGYYVFTVRVTEGSKTARVAEKIMAVTVEGEPVDGIWAIEDRWGELRAVGYPCERLTARGQGFGIAPIVRVGGFPVRTFGVTDTQLDFVIPSFLVTGYSTVEIEGPAGNLVAPIYIDVPPKDGPVRVIACDEVRGRTVESIGVVEGGRFNLAQLGDLGVNTYRIYARQETMEPVDDDGAHGLPLIGDIKMDPNLVPWNVWDANLSIDARGQGAGMDQILQGLVSNGIDPLPCLIPRWQQASISPEEQNEWWQYCFAMAYWCNVRHGLGITRWEIMNEPSLELGGTDGDYQSMLVLADDAIRFANGLAAIPTYIHAAADVTRGVTRGYLAPTLANLDGLVDVVDYHNYADIFDEREAAEWIFSLLRQPTYNTDGIIEPLWVSEMGTYRRSYNRVPVALDLAESVMVLSSVDETVSPDAYCQGLNAFLFSDWGKWGGLVKEGGAPKEGYYAFRLVIRGLQGGRERLGLVTSHPKKRMMITRQGGDHHFVALKVGGTVGLDLYSLGIESGTATVWEYSRSKKDEIVDTLAFTDGWVDVKVPTSGVVIVEVR